MKIGILGVVKTMETYWIKFSIERDGERCSLEEGSLNVHRYEDGAIRYELRDISPLGMSSEIKGQHLPFVRAVEEMRLE